MNDLEGADADSYDYVKLGYRGIVIDGISAGESSQSPERFDTSKDLKLEAGAYHFQLDYYKEGNSRAVYSTSYCTESEHVESQKKIIDSEQVNLSPYVCNRGGGALRDSTNLRVSCVSSENKETGTYDSNCNVEQLLTETIDQAAGTCQKDMQIALTFDDGPNVELTGGLMGSTTNHVLLDILKEHDVPATFFLIGHNFKKDDATLTEAQKKLLKRMIEDGHQISNHGFTHTNFQEMDKAKILDELQRTRTIIEEYTEEIDTARTMRYYRPPYGSINPSIIRYLALRGYRPVMWSGDRQDWDVDKSTAERMLKAWKSTVDFIMSQDNPQVNRSILDLSHEGKENTNSIVAEMITYAKSKGYQFVTVEECIGKAKPYDLNSAYVETNNHGIDVTKKYTNASGKSVFDIAVLFGANIDNKHEKDIEAKWKDLPDTDENRKLKADELAEAYKLPIDPVVGMNPQVTAQLNDRLSEIKSLQEQGTAVLLTILGNHTLAGWRAFENLEQARVFATRLAEVINRYGLDGVEIDDEYSSYDKTEHKGQSYTKDYEQSTLLAVQALRELLPDKIIAYSFYNGAHQSQIRYSDSHGKRMDHYVDYFWEMTYWNYDCNRIASDIEDYWKGHMERSLYSLGAQLSTEVASADARVSCNRQKGYPGGNMIFGVAPGQADLLTKVLGYTVQESN